MTDALTPPVRAGRGAPPDGSTSDRSHSPGHALAGSQRYPDGQAPPAPDRRPERLLVAAILRWLNAQPATYARKAHGSAFASAWPDIVGVRHGRALALEVKRPGLPLTAKQAAELRRWQAAGAVAGRVTSLADVQALLAEGG